MRTYPSGPKHSRQSYACFPAGRFLGRTKEPIPKHQRGRDYSPARQKKRRVSGWTLIFRKDSSAFAIAVILAHSNGCTDRRRRFNSEAWGASARNGFNAEWI